MPRPGAAYAKAGVDVAKVGHIHTHLWRVFEGTFGARRGRFGEPALKLGHYAGLISLGRDKLLALHVDGVGTKVLIAQLMDKFDTVGIDCVAMCVNDLICVGAEPVALVDYLALQRADAALVRSVAKGLAQGARQASVAIVAGETAIMGDVVQGIDGKGFDLAAMAVGVVDKNQLLDGSRIRAGDVVVGAASSGIHANGLTLGRKVLLKDHTLKEYMPELGRTLGQELLEPTAIYVRPALKALQECEIHGLAHITGGAFAKLARLLGSRRLRVVLNRMPAPPPIFELIQRSSRVSHAEMYRVFNMGVGLCVFSPRREVERIGRIFRTHGFPTFEVGHIQRGEGIVLGETPIA